MFSYNKNFNNLTPLEAQTIQTKNKFIDLPGEATVFSILNDSSAY